MSIEVQIVENLPGTTHIIKQTQIGDGLLSTVWLFGVPHLWIGDDDYFYETAWLQADGDTKILERYKTELEARAGHKNWIVNLEPGPD